MIPKLTWSILHVLLVSIAYFGDKIVRCVNPEYYIWRGLTDNSIHYLVSVLTWILVYYQSNRKCYVFSNITWECLLAGFVGSAIDIDHFVVARTYHFETAITHISISRPFFHCTSLWIFLCWLLSLVYHNLAVLVLTSVLSHHLRDAARRGLWFYPLFSTPPLPSLLYLGLIVALPVISSEYLKSHVNKSQFKEIFLV